MPLRANNQGSMLINLVLLIVCIGILAGVSVPSFKQQNKRAQYREIVEAADSTTGTIEKCLGLERDSAKCDTTDELIPYGFSPVNIELNTLIEEMTFELKDGVYTVQFIPPDTNQKASFLDATHTYIRDAEIVDRNGRPIIKEWTTDPHSGCLKNGYCE